MLSNDWIDCCKSFWLKVSAKGLNSKINLLRTSEPQNPLWDLAHFHRRVGSLCKGEVWVMFPPPKVGVTRTEPHWAILVESSLPCDMGITNKHSTSEVFLGNGESFVYWRKCWAKVSHPSWTSYIVALCTLWAFFFFLGFISRLHCVGLLWDHDSNVAAVAIGVQLKPRPTIRVLAVVETRAVTELGYTAPSLLGWGALGPKRTRSNAP